MRAARMLWAKIVSSSIQRQSDGDTAHPLPDLGWSLAEQDPFNNIARTCVIEALAAVGRHPILHTNTPGRSDRPCRRTSPPNRPRYPNLPGRRKQTSAKRLIPWGPVLLLRIPGRTAERASALIQEVLLGGMAKPSKKYLCPNCVRIEEVAARKHTRIDSGKDQILASTFSTGTRRPHRYLKSTIRLSGKHKIRRINEVKRRDEGAAGGASSAYLPMCPNRRCATCWKPRLPGCAPPWGDLRWSANSTACRPNQVGLHSSEISSNDDFRNTGSLPTSLPSWKYRHLRIMAVLPDRARPRRQSDRHQFCRPGFGCRYHCSSAISTDTKPGTEMITHSGIFPWQFLP